MKIAIRSDAPMHPMCLTTTLSSDGVFSELMNRRETLIMKVIRYALSATFALALTVAGFSFSDGSIYAQRRTPPRTSPARPAAKPLTSYDLGYQKGYNAGFTTGEADWRQGRPQDAKASDAFQKRESAYEARYASDDEYTLAYELGFELGYADGYYGRAKNLATPANGQLMARAQIMARNERERRREGKRAARAERTRAEREAGRNIAEGAELTILLDTPISTKTNKVGDRFTATIVSPDLHEGIRVEGFVASLNKSGRVTGKTELGLAFDKLVFEEGDERRIEAELLRIVESDKVRKVDEEGRVESGSRTRDSAVRGGVGAAAGAIIGAVIGGGKGAAIGAAVGGGAGVSTVAIEGSKDLELQTGTEMVIKVLRNNVRR